MRMMMGVTYGLKPDGQTTLVGEEGDINKTSSPPHDLKKLEKRKSDSYNFSSLTIGILI